MRRPSIIAAAFVLTAACGGDLEFELCEVDPIRQPASGTNFDLQELSASDVVIPTDSGPVISFRLRVRVARTEFFGAVPAESAVVVFTPRSVLTSITPDSALTDSMGEAAATATAAGDSAIIDVEAFAGGVEVNSSPKAFCATRGIGPGQITSPAVRITG